MIDIKQLQENLAKYKKGAEDKGVEVEFEKIIRADEERKNLIQRTDKLRADQNKANDEIAAASPEEKKQKIGLMKKLSDEVKELTVLLRDKEDNFHQLMSSIPNPALDNVPVGKSDKDNKVLKKVGDVPKMEFEPKSYLEIGEKLDIIDVKRAAKVSGSRFGYLKGDAVKLQFALLNYALAKLDKNGFTAVLPPVMVKRPAMEAMGFLDRSEEDVFQTMRDKYYLVGTSEQSIGPMHMDEILDEKKLPLKYFGYSTCFRREAGSYGKDTKGILRVHQFDKVEMFCFSKPEESEKLQEDMLGLIEEIMQELKLPYQVVALCTGDMGTPQARTFDIETWVPSENKYRETHSISTCTDFQARRLNTKYKKDGKNEFVHTLNGTCFAFGRMIIAIIENYQKEDGTYDVPEILTSYYN